ncbi:hypothetical protein [Leeia oryzae]|uniref:hypothetical protein n=1 Tax=Leeia oryzae TaxID=356662 RepID=UPI000360A3ED|nr:hypothetical protein [Leeia oryzae]
MSKHFTEAQQDKLWEDYKQVMSLNEANPQQAARFSYAQKANSTYSFGMAQYDVGAHADARKFLKTHDFTDHDIKALSQHGGLDKHQLSALNHKLSQIPQAEMETFSRQQFDKQMHSLEQLIGNVDKKNPVHASTIRQDNMLAMALIDYKNQYGSFGPGFTAYVSGESYHSSTTGKTISASDTLDIDDIKHFRDHTKYGVKHRDDSDRRIHNIKQVFNAQDLIHAENTPPHQEKPHSEPAAKQASATSLQRHPTALAHASEKTPHLPPVPEGLQHLYQQVHDLMHKDLPTLHPAEKHNLMINITQQAHDMGAKKVDYLFTNQEKGLIHGQCDEFKDIQIKIADAVKPPMTNNHPDQAHMHAQPPSLQQQPTPHRSL